MHFKRKILLTIVKYLYTDIWVYTNTLSLSNISFFFCYPEIKPLCFLFIVSQTCFNKNNFLLLLNNGVSQLFVLLDNLITLILLDRQKKIRLNCVPHPPWIFQTQRGHGRIRQSKQSEANVVVTNTIATTSTVTSSHTTCYRMTLDRTVNKEMHLCK